MGETFPGKQELYTDSAVNFNTPEAKIAKEVATQFISKKLGRQIKMQMVRKEADIMLRLTEEIESRHELALNNMCNRLNVNAENAYRIFCEIAEEIFRDGINWGRIIVLYAFAGRLAEHCKKTDNEHLIEKVAFWVGTFVAKKSTWIKESGRGWTGFVETFRDARSEKENTWFQGLFAATVGLGTLAAALYIKS